MSCNPNLLDNSGPELTDLPGRPLIVASGASGTCFMDRWWGYRGGATGYMIANAGADGYPNQIFMSRNTGNADTTALVIGQSTGIAANGPSTVDVVLRSLNRVHSGLSAQTLVFSIYARAGTGFSGSGFTLEIVTAFSDVNICSGAWTVEASATFPRSALSTGSWRRFQVTLSLLPGRPVLGVRVRFNDPSGTAVAEDTLWLTGAKLELSATGAATEYVMPTIHESLQRCKRFYQAFGGSTGEIACAAFATGHTVHERTFLFPVEMIKTPTPTKTGTWFVNNCSQPSIVRTTTRGFTLQTTAATDGMFAYRGNSPDDLVIFDAETH